MIRFLFRFSLLCLPLAACLFFPLFLSAQIEYDTILPGDNIIETEGSGLLIRSNPGAARVFIDGIERGRTPLRLERLREGRYYVQVVKEGYSGRFFRVSVRRGSLLDVSVELKEALGKLFLNVRPAPDAPPPDRLPMNPRFFVDGEVLQQTGYGSAYGPAYSQAAMELPVGFRTILVQAFGWEDQSATVYIGEDSFAELSVIMKPAGFSLSGASLGRSTFNPANSGSLGTTTFHFEVSAPGRGSFTVTDQSGRQVLSRQLGRFETWYQSAVWDGRNADGEIQEDGVYTLSINAQSQQWDNTPVVEGTLSLEVVLDSSKIIYPLTFSSGKSGLLFAPFPLLLPVGSFQLEGNLLGGYPAGVYGAWKSLPFAAAFRFSPLERMEASAALNVIPLFEKETKAGIAGSLKWVFLNPVDGIFGAAAGAVFSWSGKTGLTPFGMASGVEIYFPLSVDLGQIFSAAVSPAILWTDDEGFPWDPVPRLLVSGGVMAQFRYAAAGLSVRTEYNFSQSGEGTAFPPSVMAAAEVKIFPPPSSFVFSLSGGIWNRNKTSGGFGGLSIGMIY